LGADICALLGSSDESAVDAALMLKDSFGIHAQPFSYLEELLEVARPDAIAICTPPHLHFNQILAAFDRNIPIFCEKPLFWHKGITRADIEKKLGQLGGYSKRRLFINTSNANFVDRVVEEVGEPRSIRTFFFRFYTSGAHTGRDIAFDLLPHGLSLLQRLFGPMEIYNLTEDVCEHTYNCSFRYGECVINFSFQEIPDGPKVLDFAIDGHEFIRIQEGRDVTYRVFLKDSRTGRKLEAMDPFQAYITQFIDYCSNGTLVWEDEFDKAASNLRLMSDILLRKY
jgi:hypothetical protein